MRKNLLKRGVAIGLSVTMIGSSTATWAENLESSSAEQEAVTQELNLQKEVESQEENVEEVAEVSVQTETVPAVSEVIEYPEETSVYLQEVLTTAEAEVLPEEVVTESTATEVESGNSEQLNESMETQISVEVTAVSTEQETESTAEAKTEIESEIEIEAESELASESEPETQTQEFESFEELETEGYLDDVLVENDLQYRISDSQVTIVGYLGSDSAITIPATIDGYPVTAIGYQAFYQNQTITEVILPEGLITIGYAAFQGSGLTSVVIPGSVTRVSDSAFQESQLASVTFVDGEENIETILGDYVFKDCEKLETIAFSKNITHIGMGIIYGTNVKSVYLPKNVNCAGGAPVGSFSNAQNLKEIILADGTEIISSHLAANAKALENIVIPSSVKIIENNAFRNTKNLKKVILPEGLTTIEENAFTESGLNTIVIPSSVTEIAQYAFSYCQNLIIYGIPGSYAETYAKENGIVFKDGSDVYTPFELTSIAFPEKFYLQVGDVSKITYTSEPGISEGQALKARWENSDEQIVTIDQGGVVTALKNGTAQVTIHIGGLTASCEIEVTDVPQVEGDYEYKILNGEVVITKYLGSDSTVVIPDTIAGYPVTVISDRVFYQNQTITQITLPESLTKIGSYAFAESGLTSVVIPKNITRIDDYAFQESQLESAVFTDGDEQTKTTLGQGTFYNCKNLETVKLSENITTMGQNIIYGTNVKSIVVPKRVESKIEGMSGSLANDKSLREIIFAEGTERISDDIATYAKCVENIIIPSGVKQIGTRAFEETYGLTQLFLPEGLETIGNYAFAYSGLKNISIPASVTEIGEYTFLDCKNLVIYGIPGSYAETYANENGITFKDGSDVYTPFELTSIAFPAKFYLQVGDVSKITYTTSPKVTEEQAMTARWESNDTQILVVNSSGVVTALKNGTAQVTIHIGGLTASCEIEVTDVPQIEGDYEYKILNGEAVITKYLGNDATVTIPDTIAGCPVTVISDRVFYQNQTITQITLPESLTKIGSYAFAESGLTSVVIPKNITRVDDYAFQASQLKSAVFTDGDEQTETTLGQGVFDYCKNLETVKLSGNTTKIGASIIYGTKVKSIIVPKRAEDGTHTPAGPFCNDQSLKEIIFAEGTEIISSDIAARAEAVENVVIPLGVKTIKAGAFRGTYSLKQLILPDGLETIESGAFSSSGLESIAIPASVTEIGAYSFSNYERLVIYGIPGSYAETYANENGITFKDGSEVCWPFKLTSLVLPENAQMTTGEEYSLVYNCSPNINEAQAATAKWTSNNEQVATVDQNGTVTAVGEGIAEITVSLGGLTASCQIKVQKKFEITEVSAIAYNKLKISWDANADADGYVIYRMNDDGSYSTLKYITDRTILSYVNTVTCGVTYTYKVSPYRLDGKKKVFLTESEPMSAKALPAAPSLQSVNMAAYNKIRITWSKVNGCAGYVIYRSEAEDGKYSVLKTVTQASATNYVNVVKTSTTYYYKIRAFVTVNGKKVYGDYSDILSGNVITGPPQNFTIKQAANGKITFTWNKVEDADGYVIYLYDPDTNKYKAIKNVTDIDVLTYGKKMTKGTTYHFAMRAYRLVNGVKVYSDYGEIVSTQ